MHMTAAAAATAKEMENVSHLNMAFSMENEAIRNV